VVIAGETHGSRSREPRLTVGVIGAGRVGSVLGAALARAGHTVTGVSAVSDASVRRAGALLPGVPLLDPDAVAARCALLLLAVPDDSLGALVAGLAATGALRPGQLVVHTSGRHGTAVLAPAAACGALTLAVHPAMTFTGDGVTDLARIAGACFAITAEEALLLVGEALVLEMGGEAVVVAEEARPLYHAALAHGAGHLVTLISQALDALAAAGVAAPARVLAPLASAALDGALRAGDAATTGPVVRGDAGTVRSHLAVLGESQPATVEAYRALARATTDRAIARGRLRARDAGELLDVLGLTGTVA